MEKTIRAIRREKFLLVTICALGRDACKILQISSLERIRDVTSTIPKEGVSYLATLVPMKNTNRINNISLSIKLVKYQYFVLGLGTYQNTRELIASS